MRSDAPQKSESESLLARRLAPALAALLLAAAPETPAQGSAFAWNLPAHFPAPQVPADNPMSADKVELGRHLFYETRLSANGRSSCGTCHNPRLAFTDGRARAVGTTGETHPRGAMSLANVAYASRLAWANPLLDRLEEQALLPMFGDDPVEMGLAGHEAEALATLRADRRYQALFSAAFPGEEDPFTLAHITQAIACFERTLLSGSSPYDRFVAGDEAALSAPAKRGMTLFFSERTECFHCHGGFTFSDATGHQGREAEIAFHNTGLYNLDGLGAYPADNTGLYAFTFDPADMGRFKAPTLRNIAVTAPYMHDGSIATLRGVIEHYAAGGRATGASAESPLRSEFVPGFILTEEETTDMIAFLESLTDKAFLEDPRFADPFPRGDVP